MVRASGLIKIGLNIEGLEKGSKVVVKSTWLPGAHGREDEMREGAIGE